MEETPMPEGSSRPSFGLLIQPTGAPPTAPEDGFGPLTQEEQGSFEYLRAAMGNRIDGAQPVLFRVRHQDRDRAVVAVVTEDADGSMVVSPLALLLDDALFADLNPGS